MASRRGRFGRRRSTSSNLTLMIASLMREQKAAEDRAIFDAYSNGGLFQGKPVDDKRILAYITTRRDGFSTDDPLYDEWNNRLIQTNFSIGEQKIGLLFKQGKVGAGAVAAYYRGQLGKIPKDSAFYREVAGRAAEWAKAVGGGRGGAAGGGARARAGAAMDSKIDAQQSLVDDYTSLERFLNEVATASGFINANQTLTDASAQDIQRLFDMGLVVNGQPVTYEMWQKAAVGSYNAQRQVIILSEQAGRTTKDKRTALQKFIDFTLVRANAVDDRAKYEAAREKFQSDIDKTDDPNKALAIAKAYIATLNGIRDAAMQVGGLEANDPEFIGGLMNEIEAITTGQASGPTVTDLQSNAGEEGTTKDADFLAGLMNNPVETPGKRRGIFQDYEALNSGAAFLGQAEPGGEIRVIDYPTVAGQPTGVKNLPKEYTQSVVNIDGETQVVNLMGTAVMASVLLINGQVVDPLDRDPAEVQAMLADGRASISQTASVLGYVYTQPSGKRSYGIVTPNGILFTEANPFENLAIGKDGVLTVMGGDASGTLRENGTGLTFFPTSGLNLAAAAAITGQPIAGYQMTLEPFLADDEISVADLTAIIGGKGNESLDAMLAGRADKAAKDAERKAAKLEARFGEPATPVKDFGEALVKASPFGQWLAPAVGVVGDLVRTAMTPPPALTGAGGVNLRPPNAPPPFTPPPITPPTEGAFVGGKTITPPPPGNQGESATVGGKTIGTGEGDAIVGGKYVPPPDKKKQGGGAKAV